MTFILKLIGELTAGVYVMCVPLLTIYLRLLRKYHIVVRKFDRMGPPKTGTAFPPNRKREYHLDCHKFFMRFYSPGL